MYNSLSSSWPSVPETLVIASRSELTDLKLNVAQQLPSDLQGHFFMVAPVGSVASGGLPYPDGDNVFNGDGMIYRFDFDTPGEVKVTTRLAKPPCYYADLATQTHPKYAKYKFRNFGVERFSPYLGARNQLNTAFLPMVFDPEEPERLLITYDGGRPFEIDTQTLETVTPVGQTKEWHPEAPQKVPFSAVMSTAHPCFDPYTKEMFSVNYGRSLSNFLETIPAIFWLDHLPSRLETLIDSVAEFLRQQRWPKRIPSDFRSHKRVIPFPQKQTNLGIQNFVYVIRWNGTGELERWKVLLPDGSPVTIEQSMHQMGISRDYLILMDTAFKVGLEQILNNPIPESKTLEKLLRELLTRPVNPDSLVYLVRRRDLKEGEASVIAKPVKIPLPAFHFLVDYDNPQGQITLHIGHPAGQDVSEWIRSYDIAADEQSIPSYLQGFLTEATDVSRLGRYVIDGESGEILTAKVIYDTQLTWGLGFCGACDRPTDKIEQIYWQAIGFWHDLIPRFIYDLYRDYPYRIVPSQKLFTIPNPGSNRLPCLLRLDTQSMTIADAYLFPQVSPDGKNWDSQMLGSPQFMPRADGDGSPTDGYIICTVNTSNADEIWIFDAANLAQGPLCQLSHPELKFATTLHTTWLSKIAPRTASYNCSIRQDYEEIVRKQPSQIQELFETQVYPHFKG